MAEKQIFTTEQKSKVEKHQAFTARDTPTRYFLGHPSAQDTVKLFALVLNDCLKPQKIATRMI
jgi:hypothetical protein